MNFLSTMIPTSMKTTFLIAMLVGFVAHVSAQDITFDDSDPTIMRLVSTSNYEIGFRKSNGSIAYIRDQNTGNDISQGSRFEQLWGTVAYSGDPVYIGAANYSPSGANKFNYEWNENNSTLRLKYTPDSTAWERINVMVEVTASTNSFFDCKLSLTSERSAPIDLVIFPSDLVFLENEITEALLPFIPGALLKSSFFKQSRSYESRYPSAQAFADFVSIRHQNGYFALYHLIDADRPVPLVNFGFRDDNEYIANSTYFTHSFETHIEDNLSWTSPVVRIHIGENHLAAINAWHADNSIDNYPSISEKLGSNFTRVKMAPILKADFKQLRQLLGLQKFTDYNSFLETLPTPSIFHPVTYHTGEFDTHYPDFYPPDPDFGTPEEFRALFDKAHSLGLMVMPYTNPTWWNEDSPTIQNELSSLTIDDIAASDGNGQAIFETYGDKTGIVVSPQHAFVVNRVDRLIEEMTVELPSDFVFQDQIGARRGFKDFNPASGSPLQYTQKWLEHTKKYSHKGLATEFGFDRLLETEIGFHGTLLLWEKFGLTDQWFGDGNWEYYPFTSLAANDKVLFYQHNLASETTTSNQATFIWNLAFGFMLTYDLWADLDQRPEWLRVVSQFQSLVCSRYAGKKMTDYLSLQPEVTQSTFETISVITNWNSVASNSIGNHIIPPLGTLAMSHNGNLEAGIFTVYNGTNLSSGNHYIIVDKILESDTIRVYQPLGNDTQIGIERSAKWSDDGNIFVIAVGSDTTFDVSRTLTSDAITFEWKRKISNRDITNYVLTTRIPSSVEHLGSNIPEDYSLYQNYPNPFNPTTTITFAIPEPTEVSLLVFDLLGRVVKVLIEERLNAGVYNQELDMKGLPSGTYFYQLQAKGKNLTKRFLLLK